MKKIILSIAVLALALSSCEDFLTKEPPMDQSDELALSTFEGIDGATAGIGQSSRGMEHRSR